MENNRITVKCTINSNIDKVWEAWTEPNQITKWNFASDEWCCPSAVNDLRPSGKFSSRMEAKDGSMGFDFEGVYDEVKKNESISYNMQDGRKVDIKFNSIGNDVEVVETFDTEGTNADEQQRAGWQSILNNFKNYVENE